MFRWVAEEHVGRLATRGQEQAHVRALVRLVRIEGHRAVPEHALDVVVARENPAVDHPVVVHGLVPAQAREHGMGIRPERPVERGELDPGGDAVGALGRPLAGHRASQRLSSTTMVSADAATSSP